MNAFSVLRVNAVEEQSDYASAVARIIDDIQRSFTRKHDLKQLTHEDIAEAIGVSVGTIANAANKRGSLSSIYLARLGQRFGAPFLNPYFALFGAQAAPITNKAQVDVLPVFARVTHKMADARDPAGPGGAAEIPQERAGYLNDLKQAVHHGGCLIAEIEEQLA